MDSWNMAGEYAEKRPRRSARKLRASRAGCNVGLGWGDPIDHRSGQSAIRYGKTGEKVQNGVAMGWASE